MYIQSDKSHHSPVLQLGLGAFQQLGSSPRNGRLACVYHRGLEENHIALLPHLRPEGLARQHHTGEADLEVLEGTICAEHMLARDTQRAEAVQNGGLKATHLAELGVNVQRVAVAVEAVERGLVFRGLLLDNRIGLALRRLVGRNGGLGAASSGLGRSAKAATATDEDGRLVVEEILAGLRVLGGIAGDDEGGVALVHDVDELGVGQSLGCGGNGELADLHVLLAMQQHHRGEVGDNLVHVPGVGGVEPRDHTVCGQSLEVLVVLIHQGKISALSAETEVVEDDIPILVVKGRAIGGGLLGLLDGLQDLVTALRVTAAAVAHVGHDLLRTGLAIFGVVRTAIVEVGDLLPVLEHFLRGKLNVDRESMTAGTLPASAAEPAAATLVQTLCAGLRHNVRAKKSHQGSNVVRLERLDHLLGHDGTGHVGTSIGGNGVDLDVVLSTLESKSARESKNSEFLIDS